MPNMANADFTREQGQHEELERERYLIEEHISQLHVEQRYSRDCAVDTLMNVNSFTNEDCRDSVHLLLDLAGTNQKHLDATLRLIKRFRPDVDIPEEKLTVTDTTKRTAILAGLRPITKMALENKLAEFGL
ncbi:MAG: hypothetical protein ACK5GN_13275 [Pseudomonadota bacterium]|jgi:hypothetical protein